MRHYTVNKTGREMNVSRIHEGDLPGVYIPGSKNGHGAMQTARPCWPQEQMVNIIPAVGRSGPGFPKKLW